MSVDSADCVRVDRLSRSVVALTKLSLLGRESFALSSVAKVETTFLIVKKLEE